MPASHLAARKRKCLHAHERVCSSHQHHGLTEACLYARAPTHAKNTHTAGMLLGFRVCLHTPGTMRRMRCLLTHTNNHTQALTRPAPHRRKEPSPSPLNKQNTHTLSSADLLSRACRAGVSCSLVRAAFTLVGRMGTFAASRAAFMPCASLGSSTSRERPSVSHTCTGVASGVGAGGE